VLNDSICIKYYNDYYDNLGVDAVDHAVVIVGYNNSADVPYWIAKVAFFKSAYTFS
jgi:hypothetical protein